MCEKNTILLWTVQDVFKRNSPRFHQVALKEHIKVLTWKSLCSSHSPARAWHIYRHVHKLVCLCSQCSVKSLNSHSPAAFTPLSSEHQGSEVCFVPLSFVRFQAERCDWLLVARGAEPLIVRGGSSQLICSQLEQSVSRRLAACLFWAEEASDCQRHSQQTTHTHTHTHRNPVSFFGTEPRETHLTWGSSQLKMMMFVSTWVLMKSHFLWPVSSNPSAPLNQPHKPLLMENADVCKFPPRARGNDLRRRRGFKQRSF